MPARFIDIIVDVPALLDRQFTYGLPEGVWLPTGAKVRVPFGRGEADGFVMSETCAPPNIAVKPVKAVYDLEFLPKEPLQRLACLVSEEYCAALSSCMSCLWPPVVLRVKTDRVVSLPKGGEDAAGPRGPGRLTLVRGDREYRWARYLERIRQTRAAGKGVLVLVPEIKGMAVALDQLEESFLGQVAEIHSELTGVARRGAYLSLLRRERHIAVGTRAAVFAPVADLGLIVVEEESSEAYKSPESPFYDAKVVAGLRSGLEGCDVLFGSGHPTVESVWRVRDRQIEELTQEPVAAAPPTVLVDLKQARRGGAILSTVLVESLARTFERGGRAVLFLNRRGEFTQVTCRDCGNTLMCERCNVPLSYHAKEKRLVCHTCGQGVDAPDACPKCGGRDWYFAGFGIERAQKEFQKMFPAVPLFRMDKESSKEQAPAHVMGGFASASPACLLATSTVVRLGGMPPVDLVGVLSCDTILSLPDYRASEKAFHLLSSLRELVGPSRLGAGFIAQTYNPDNPGVKGVLDPDSFYSAQIEERRILGYPPFRRFFKVHFHGKNLDRVREAAGTYAAAARSEPLGPDVLGPTPAPKAKVRGEYWYQLALRGGSAGRLCSLHRRIAPGLGGGVKITLDGDSI